MKELLFAIVEGLVTDKSAIQITEDPVFFFTGGAVVNQQTGRIPRFGRSLRNALLRQFIVKIGSFQYITLNQQC